MLVPQLDIQFGPPLEGSNIDFIVVVALAFPLNNYRDQRLAFVLFGVNLGRYVFAIAHHRYVLSGDSELPTDRQRTVRPLHSDWIVLLPFSAHDLEKLLTPVLREDLQEPLVHMPCGSSGVVGHVGSDNRLLISSIIELANFSNFPQQLREHSHCVVANQSLAKIDCYSL